MSQERQYDQALDVKGMSCPIPILRTKKFMDGLSREQVLRVETTDPRSKNDMAAWAQRTGNTVLRIEEASGIFTFYIQKTA